MQKQLIDAEGDRVKNWVKRWGDLQKIKDSMGEIETFGWKREQESNGKIYKGEIWTMKKGEYCGVETDGWKI